MQNDGIIGKPDINENSLPISKSLLREKVVILLQGKNINGDQIYTYTRMALWKLQELRDAMRQNANFMPSDYGEVLHSGYGDPSDELRESLTIEHNMIDVPRGGGPTDTERNEINNLWRTGFREAYHSILGADAKLPSVSPPQDITKSNALSAGIRHGLQLAALDRQD